MAISDALSDIHQWTDDLYQLLGALDLSPACLFGGSGGHVLSLLMAHRYPEDVKGLLLVQTPTDDLGILGGAADAYRFSFAEIAVTQGMEQVISSSIEAWQRTVSGQEIQFADHLGLPDEKVQSLLDCYFDRYIDHGGAQMDRFIWERSCDLAFIAYALRAFPMNVPFFLQQGADSAERAKRKAEKVTQAMRQWL